MSFELKDAIALKHTYVDQTHKFWTYLQLAAVAATTLAWSNDSLPDRGVFLLAFAFGLFAYVNQRVVVEAQASAYRVSQAIDKWHAVHSATIDAELRNIINLRKPDPPGLVRLGHTAFALVVIALIAARTLYN